MTDLQQLHINNGYYIQVESLKTIAGCTVKFPNNIFKNMPPIEKTYILHDDPCDIELYVTSLERSIISKTIPATKSNIRILILQDIMLYAFKIGISKDLIIINDKVKRSLFDVLALKQTRMERELEARLCVGLIDLLAGKINTLANNVEGYNQIVNFFETGEL